MGTSGTGLVCTVAEGRETGARGSGSGMPSEPKRPPVHPEFLDRALEAAIAVLKGETYYPKLPE